MKKINSLRCFLAAIFVIPATIASAQNVFKLTPGATIKITGGELITLQNINLENDGLNPGHYEMRFAKPLDEALLYEPGRQYEKIITVEDAAMKACLAALCWNPWRSMVIRMI